MRIAFLGNNRLALEVVTWLRKRGEEIAILGVHPARRAAFRHEIIAAAGCKDGAVIEGQAINAPTGRRALEERGCELLLSVGFSYLLRPEVLRIPRKGCLNLHTSYLPFNRGSNPNIWGIVQQTPAGVTLHRIDTGIDTGEIVARRPVEVTWEDTGKTLQAKLTAAAFQLFIEAWPKVSAGRLTATPQPVTGSSFHCDRDLEALDRIDLDKSYKGRELINILRARTYPPYPGAYFVDGGVRYYLSLSITKGKRS